ncbi:2-C-methyl-D-erythritol 2,4-cyclodiphosphate synthase [Bacteroidetes/Chlorobi group bacterium Naka2016]|nr:MAG: 2-C-methyl-D-erythritol 2,4-cyclodiphosphate synthase [Bacteroidetes/Chlorobi group bacterium Naka2016]
MVGFGYDSHRIEKGRKLFLGGVLVDEEFGCIAHSDGDVVLHSLIDAILGALGLGDIGEHFPDSDVKYKDISSVFLLEKVLEKLKDANKKILNIDVTIIFELKKLSPYKQQIRMKIAELCGVDFRRVNVKAKTNEKMGFIGRGEGIASFCICQIE